MYVTVTQGSTSDPEALYRAMDRWMQDLAPGATGWLGTTAGVTEDGRAIAIYQFESEEAAITTGMRPQQAEWWSSTLEFFDREPTVRVSSDVTLDLRGDPGQAGFVQFMQGRGTDSERAKELMAQDSDQWAALRPDVIGSVAVGYEDDSYTMVTYFVSEAEARVGEAVEVPPELQANMEEMGRLSVGPPEFFDLKRPMILSPAGP